jgi:hypothetical protein
VDDSEARGLILRRLYDLRHDASRRMVGPKEFEDIELPEHVVGNIVEQLQGKGLIAAKVLRTGAGLATFMARILAPGVDVIEGKTRPPMAITVDNSVNIHGSQNVQVGGSGNVQNVTMDIQKLISLVDSAGASVAEKEEAKSLLKKLADNKLVQWALTKWASGGTAG